MPPIRVSPVTRYHPPIIKDDGDRDWPISDMPPQVKGRIGEGYVQTPLGDDGWPMPNMGSGAGSDFFENLGGRMDE